MAHKHTTVLRFGRRRNRSPEPQSDRKNAAAADSVFVMGVAVVSLFFITALSGRSLSHDAARVESVFRDAAVPVMSSTVSELPEDPADIREILRDNIRDTAGEPFGYMGGRWNLWEYLGDVMAALLVG